MRTPTLDTDPPRESAVDPSPPLRRLHHRRRWSVMIVVVAVAAAGGLAVAQRWRSRGPQQASVNAAVDRFRSSSTAPAAPAAIMPAPGVYTYTGGGTERLSFMATSQAEGPTLPATVAAGDDGCFTFEIEYNSFHRQNWEWCNRGGRLVERGGTTHQKFDFVAFKVDETSTITCAPPFVSFDTKAKPGSAVETHCTGRSVTTKSTVSSDGTLRLVGRETLTIDGSRMPALHYVADRALTGDQTGHEHNEMWFSVRDGLPLRNERTTSVDSPAPAPLNEVTYTEHGWWQLTAPSAQH
jgi:hypothetical protein